MSGTESGIKNKCEFHARLGWISERNTQSYITDLLRTFAGPDKLNIQDFVTLIEGLEP